MTSLPVPPMTVSLPDPPLSESFRPSRCRPVGSEQVAAEDDVVAGAADDRVVAGPPLDRVVVRNRPARSAAGRRRR